MTRVYIEQRALATSGMSVLAADLTHHIYTRLTKGKLVVVAEEPFLLLRMARKHWLRLQRAVQRERAKTLHAGRIAELSTRLLMLQQIEFAAKLPTEAPAATIFFLAPHEVEGITSECHTVYVTCSLAPENLHTVTEKMQSNGLVVTYQIQD